MRYQDVHTGSEYRLASHNWLGRCVVTGSGIKGRLNGRYRFPVEFPDAKPSSHKPSHVEAADLRGPWTRKDQEQWETSQRESAERSAIEQALIAADFPPSSIRSPHGGQLWIMFQDDVAKRVVEALLASVTLKDEILELETHGPHDES